MKVDESLDNKLNELDEEELVEADGGLAPGRKYWNRPMHAVDESICDKNE